jgi:hypothetical protein
VLSQGKPNEKRKFCPRETPPKIISLLSLRCNPLHRSTLSIFLTQRQSRHFSTKTASAMSHKLPRLPDVPGADPSRAVLDAFKVAIAKRIADALPPLTVEQVYQGVDYGKKGVDFTIALPRFRLPGKVDVLAKTVIDQVCDPRTTSIPLSLMTFLSMLPAPRAVSIASSSKRTITSSRSRTTRHSCTSCSRRPPLSARCSPKSTSSRMARRRAAPSTARTRPVRARKS